MFFISPPFGNYIQIPNTTRIYGSFTLQPRDGLWMQVFKTLRYMPKYGGWVNKIGLRNKGVDWALCTVPKNHIISVAIMNETEIKPLVQKIPKDRNIEINISCPNVEKHGDFTECIGEFLNNERKWCILKVSPNTTREQLDMYYKQGFRQFHCSNTVPVPEGGLSGQSVKPYTVQHIEYLRETYPDTELIAGGGITQPTDVVEYQSKGANHFSVSTGFFHPIKMTKLWWWWWRKNE